jgi:hypothetical protein
VDDCVVGVHGSIWCWDNVDVEVAEPAGEV